MIGISAACVPCLKALSERVLKRIGVHISFGSQPTKIYRQHPSYGMKNYGSQQSRSSTANRPFSHLDGGVWDGVHPLNATINSPTGFTPASEKPGVIIKDVTSTWETTSGEATIRLTY